MRRAVRSLIARAPVAGRAARACARSSVSCGREPAARDRRRDRPPSERRRLHEALPDRARADGEVVADRVGARDRALGDDRERPAAALNPKPLGVLDQALARRACAPIGAKTELHDSAKACSSVPPQTSSPAFASLTPDSGADDAGAKVSLSFADAASSAAAVVTILNVEPGGWTIENGTPA